jgi:hypothetical protein
VTLWSMPCLDPLLLPYCCHSVLRLQARLRKICEFAAVLSLAPVAQQDRAADF